MSFTSLHCGQLRVATKDEIYLATLNRPIKIMQDKALTLRFRELFF